MIAGRNDVYGAELMGALSAELSARGVAVTRRTTRRGVCRSPTRPPSWRRPTPTSWSSPPTRRRRTCSPTRARRLPGRPDRRPRRDVAPRLAEQTFPSDPAAADGLTVIATTGDRAMTAACRRSRPSRTRSRTAGRCTTAPSIALAAIAAAGDDPAAIGAAGRRHQRRATCSTFAHCACPARRRGGHRLLGHDRWHPPRRAGRHLDGPHHHLTGDRQRPRGDRCRRESTWRPSARKPSSPRPCSRPSCSWPCGPSGTTKARSPASTTRRPPPPSPPSRRRRPARHRRVRRGDRRGAPEPVGDGSATLDASVQLQQELTALGYYAGPIDGRYSAATIAAVRAAPARPRRPPDRRRRHATLQAIYAVRGQANPLPPPPPPTTSCRRPPPPPPPHEPRRRRRPRPPSRPRRRPHNQPPPPITEPPPAEPTIFQVLQADPDFSILVELLAAAGYNGRPRRARIVHAVRDPHQRGVRGRRRRCAAQRSRPRGHPHVPPRRGRPRGPRHWRPAHWGRSSAWTSTSRSAPPSSSPRRCPANPPG